MVLDNRAPGITVDCAEACSSIGADCPSFSVDYGGQRCFKMDRNTQGTPYLKRISKPTKKMKMREIIISVEGETLHF